MIDFNGKTYLALSNSELLPVEEIRKLYDGYWVYVVNAEFNERQDLIRGVPVVIGTMAFAGADDGIYSKYDDPMYGEYDELILLKTNIIFSLNPVGERQ